MSDLSPSPGRGPLRHWPEPLAFVFSGGGSYGAVQVGMLRALLEAGITPDLVVGSSVGALNGIRYAASPGDAVEALEQVWRSMGRSGVFGGRTRPGQLWSATRRILRRNTSSAFSPERLRALIDANVPALDLNELPVPAAIVVTDALLGRPKALTRGQLGPLLQASAALPGIFPPVQVDGCFYIDGGVTANVPIRQAIDLGARGVVVLDANPRAMPGTIPDSFTGALLHASMIMLRNQRADADDQLKGRLPILHLPQPTPAEQSSFDFAQADELMMAGYSSTRSFLAQLPELADTNRGLSEPPPDEATLADIDRRIDELADDDPRPAVEL